MTNKSTVTINSTGNAAPIAELMQVALDYLGDSIFWVDANGQVIYANDAACCTLDYPFEEMLTLRVQDFDQDFKPEMWPSRPYKKKNCGAFIEETLYRSKSGRIIPVEVVVRCIKHGDEEYGCAIVREIADDNEVKEQLQASDTLHTLFEQSPLAFQIFSPEGDSLLVNRAWEELWGVSHTAMANYNLFKDQQLVEKGIMPYIEKAFAGQTVLTPEVEYDKTAATGVTGQHGKLWVRTFIYPLKDADGKLREIVLVHEDVTKIREAGDSMKLAAAVYRSSAAGIMVTDENNRIVDVNPAFTSITGYTLEEVAGKDSEMLHSGKQDQEFYSQMQQAIQNADFWQGETWDRRKNGELYAKWITICVIRHADDSVHRHVWQFSDITEKKRKDELIWAQANFDLLTNLPNRRLLEDRVQQAMSASMRSGEHCALMLLDLDQFKRLNDAVGHSVGDAMLVEVARRLEGCVRDDDSIARLGGDEFVVVLRELSSNEDMAAVQAEVVAEKIRAELSLPYQLNGAEYHTTPSIGIVTFRGHMDSKEQLLTEADTAMYQAKNNGRNSICFFDPSMQAVLKSRNKIETALRNALTHEEFAVYYQLQVNNAGQLLGAEALLRWKNPSFGIVSPAYFISVAEETGLILPIGLWVINIACAQLAKWQLEPGLEKLSIAVNVSARQFREKMFVAQIMDVLKESGINPERLKLELTESMVLDNVEDSILKMGQLKKLGVKFSMDDFGTGYSSLTYLKRLPFDQIKIDQSFVSGITTNQNDAAIAQAIIAMSNSLGLEVIAEGVETEDQRNFLELHGCQAYQGNLYGKPVPVGELERKLLG